MTKKKNLPENYHVAMWKLVFFKAKLLHQNTIICIQTNDQITKNHHGGGHAAFIEISLKCITNIWTQNSIGSGIKGGRHRGAPHWNNAGISVWNGKPYQPNCEALLCDIPQKINSFHYVTRCMPSKKIANQLHQESILT